MTVKAPRKLRRGPGERIFERTLLTQSFVMAAVAASLGLDVWVWLFACGALLLVAEVYWP